MADPKPVLEVLIAAPRGFCAGVDRAIRIAHSFRLARAFHHGQSTLDIRPILEETL